MAETLNVGTPIVIARDSPNATYAAFFEDEGETGYFYAVDRSGSGNRILDAVHVYDVAKVADRDRPSQVEIIWARDGMKCALLINNYPHAAFDFCARRGYCRTNFPNFPGARGSWHQEDHSWSDEAISWLSAE
jgi:hypothetical protein